MMLKGDGVLRRGAAAPSSVDQMLTTAPARPAHARVGQQLRAKNESGRCELVQETVNSHRPKYRLEHEEKGSELQTAGIGAAPETCPLRVIRAADGHV